MLLTAVALLSAARTTPVYAASAQLLLQASPGEAALASARVYQAPERLVQTEIRLLSSTPVRKLVQQAIGAAPAVSATAVGQTDVVLVTAESTDPERAAAIANAYTTAYIQYKRQSAVDGLQSAGGEIQARLDALQQQAADLDRRIATASESAAEDLRAQRNSLIQQQGLLRTQVDQLQVQASIATGQAQIVSEAGVPSSPVRPRPLQSGLIALAVGLLLGIGVAFLLEQFDDTIKGRLDVERIAPALPIVAIVPHVEGWKPKDHAVLVADRKPNSPSAEAYKSLRTALQFMALDRPMSTVQITSPSASEGKTTTAANLAVTMADLGQRVILMDCDFRRPRLHEFFDAPRLPGITTALLGQATLAEAAQVVRGHPFLRLVPSGTPPPNPAELLANTPMAHALNDLQSECDIVVIDSPPVLPVTDAVVLAGRVDATLLVVTARKTTVGSLRRAIEILHTVNAPVVGIVLNDITAADDFGYEYGYSYAYGAGSQTPAPPAPVDHPAPIKL